MSSGYNVKYKPGAQFPLNLLLVQLLELILTRNNFEFNGQKYLQVPGTAMGTGVGTSHSNNFMGIFENDNVYPIQPKLWL